VGSNIVDNLYNVAYVTPQGKKVLIVVNDNNVDKTFVIGYKNFVATASLPAGGVATYYW
jgi:glucosylceramidase